MRPLAKSHLIPREPNFMTPNRRGLWSIRHNAKTRHVELSAGVGISREPIYGVTVRPDGEQLSKMFFSESDACKYIRELATS